MKRLNKLFLLLISFLMTIPAALAESLSSEGRMTLNSALSGIAQGVKLILSGDLGGGVAAVLTTGLVQILAFLLIVFFLSNYILHFIIREEEHKKLRSGLSWGFALLAIVMPGVFKQFTKLFTTAIGIILYIFIGAVIFILFLRMRTEVTKSRVEDNLAERDRIKSKAEISKAEGESLKEEHEVEVQKKIERAELNMLPRIRDEIEKVSSAKDLESRIQALRSAFSKLSQLRDEGQIRSYKESLSKGVSAFTNLLSKDISIIKDAERFEAKLLNLSFKGFNLSTSEQNLINRFKTLVSKELKSAGFTDKKELDEELLKYNSKLANLSSKLKQEETKRQQLESRVKGITRDMESYLQRMVSASEQLKNDLSGADYPSALKQLDEIELMNKNLSARSKQVSNETRILTSIEKNLLAIENEFENDVVKEIRDLKQEEKN